MAKNIYKSEAMASIHQMIEGAFEIDAIDKRTMREFDDACLIMARSFILQCAALG